MSKPARPEYEAVNAQMASLKLIKGGTTYHTSIGTLVYPTPRPLPDPADHIACTAVSVNPRGKPYNDQTVNVSWTAMVGWDGDDDMTPLNVLADMRHALLCGNPKLSLAAGQIYYPDSGGNFAAVALTTTIHTT